MLSLIFLPCCAQGPSTRPSHPPPIHPLFQEWALHEGNVHLVRRGRGPSTAAMVVRVARAPRAKSPKRGCGDETRTDRHRLRKHRKILPLAKNLLVIFFLSNYACTSSSVLTVSLSFPFLVFWVSLWIGCRLDRSCFFRLPYCTRWFRLWFLWITRCRRGLCLGRWTTGLETLKDVGYILDGFLLLEEHFVFSLPFDVPSNHVA